MSRQGPTSLPWIWTPEYEVDIGPHVFPTVKYRLVRDRLVEEGTLSPSAHHAPEPAIREELTAVHTPEYVEKVMAGRLSATEERLLEVPYSPELLRAFLLCCGGTTLTGTLALELGVAIHLGGGFHHAFADHGEGFCLLNDVAVALAALRARGSIRRAAVVDLDVHHGNGTAAILGDDPDVFTFSMHQEHNYPFPKPPGDLDVGLDDGTRDERYLELLDTHLPSILDDHRPELVIYLAGADPYRGDQLGGLRLSRDGLRKRDRMVFTSCRERDVPVAVVLAGGYAIVQDQTVEIHCTTVREALAAL